MNDCLSVKNTKFSLLTVDISGHQDFDYFIVENLAELHYNFLANGGTTPPLVLELNDIFSIPAPFSVDAVAVVDLWLVELFPNLDLQTALHYRGLLLQLYFRFERSATLAQLSQRFQQTQNDLLHRVESNLLLDWMTLWLVHYYPGTALFAFGKVHIMPFIRTKTFRLDDFIAYLPAFMLWQIRSSLHQEKSRKLSIELASGQNIRHLPSCPFPFNRKMAHFFIHSPCGLSFDTAIWYAIVQAWEGQECLAQYLQIHFRNKNKDPDFLKLLVFFFRKTDHPPESNEMQQLLGYLQHRWDETEQFSLKGWTLASLKRRARQWYQDLRQQRQSNYLSAMNLALNWRGASYEKFSLGIEESHYEIIQLNSVKKLEDEGRKMMHCVGNYAARCQLNGHSIWSLRQTRNEISRSLVTIEVSREHSIIQARKMFNANPEPFETELIQRWADREGLKY